MPLASVTLMLPASATRPDAVTVALVEATWPLLIPIETDAPLLQAAFDEAICTFQSPSNVAAAAWCRKAQRSKQRSGDCRFPRTSHDVPLWFGHDQDLTAVPRRL